MRNDDLPLLLETLFVVLGYPEYSNLFIGSNWKVVKTEIAIIMVVVRLVNALHYESDISVPQEVRGSPAAVE